MLLSQEALVNEDDPCTQCGGERGWFLYVHPVTKRTEIRACDLCETFSSDEEAGKIASLEIAKAIELADNITEVRGNDENIRKATAGAFHEPAEYAARRGTTTGSR